MDPEDLSARAERKRRRINTAVAKPQRPRRNRMIPIVRFDGSLILNDVPKIAKDLQLDEAIIKSLFSHWELKRLRISGRPLLRSIRVNIVSFHRNFNFRRQTLGSSSEAIKQIKKLRMDLEATRTLLYMVSKREKLKKEQLQFLGDSIEVTLAWTGISLLACLEQLGKVPQLNFDAVLKKAHSSYADLKNDIELCDRFSTIDDFAAQVEGDICRHLGGVKSFAEFHQEVRALLHPEPAKSHLPQKKRPAAADLASLQTYIPTPEEVAKDRERALEVLDAKRRGHFLIIEAVEKVFADSNEEWKRGLFRKTERRKVKEARNARMQAKRDSAPPSQYSTRAQKGSDDQETVRSGLFSLIDDLESLDPAMLMQADSGAPSGSKKRKGKEPAGEGEQPSWERIREGVAAGDCDTDFLALENAVFHLIDHHKALNAKIPKTLRALEKVRNRISLAMNRYLRSNPNLLREVSATEATPCKSHPPKLPLLSLSLSLSLSLFSRKKKRRKN